MSRKPKPLPPEVKVMDPSYQPSKAELEEDLRLDATLEELGQAVMRPVKVRYVKPQQGDPVRTAEPRQLSA